MLPTGASAEPVRSQLDNILASPEFRRSDRLSKFLRLVVEQHLAGKAAEPKESLVGIEVFGRTPGFDPRQDSVVRTEAAKLRVRLSQYCTGEAAGDPVVIELPKGGHTPVFRQAEAAGDGIVPGLRDAPPGRGSRLRLTVMLVGLRFVLTVGGWWWLRSFSKKGGMAGITRTLPVSSDLTVRKARWSAPHPLSTTRRS